MTDETHELDDGAFERAYQRMMFKRNRAALEEAIAAMPPLDFDPSRYRIPLPIDGRESREAGA